MGDKISGYPVKTTIHDDDLLDFSNTEDSGVSYTASQKVKVSELMSHINSFSQTIYNTDGNINENRTLTSNGSWTKWLGGDVIVTMDNESDDYAFIIQLVGSVERGRFGFDQINASGELSLSNLSGEFFKANDGKLLMGTLVLSPTANIMVSSEGGINTEGDYYQDNKFLLGNISGGLALGFNIFPSATGTLNIAGGQSALASLTTGSRNSVWGREAGLFAQAFDNSVLMGYQAFNTIINGTDVVGIGHSSGLNITGGTGLTFIGEGTGANASGTYDSSVAIGSGATIQASNQCVIGGDSAYLQEYHFGQGIERAGAITPSELNMYSTSITDGSAADIAPSFDWIWNGSQGTGTGVGSDHVWKVAPAGSTGTTRNSLVEVLRLKGDGNINMSNVPTSSVGLSAGDLWNDSGVLSIV